MTHTEDIKRLRKSLLDNEDFECWLINVLDSEDLTDTEKIKLIRTRI
jgi:hypothetical protein